jgi:acetamidase/formamidase
MSENKSVRAHLAELSVQPDAILCSTPETVLWGYIAANLPAALTVKSEQVVQIEALSHQGLTTNKDPEKFFGAYGIPSNEVLADAKTVFTEVKRPRGASVHILTGPIYVEGAEPGDTLEVRVLDIKFRVPYGVNNTGPGKGVLPGLLKEPSAKVIRLDLERRVALFSDDIQIPLNPFMGIMAVSPPTSLGMVSSTPPGAWGGNIDLKFLRHRVFAFFAGIQQGRPVFYRRRPRGAR